MTVLGLAAPLPEHGEPIEFRLLGPVTVHDGATGAGVVPSGPKQRALLAALVVHAGERLPVDRLVEELWGDRPPADAPNALQTHIARLRRLLRSGCVPEHERISTLPTAYLLTLRHASTDVARFTRLSAQGRAAVPHDPRHAVQVLSRALSLWQGPALQDSRLGPICAAEADRLEEQRLTVLEALHEARLGCGGHAGITSELERLTEEHPLRERFYDLLMVALWQGGREAEALGVYERARRRLITALGIEPGPALRFRVEEILGRSSTPAARAPRPADPATTSATATASAPASASASVPAPAPAPAPAYPQGRTGRSAWEREDLLRTVPETHEGP